MSGFDVVAKGASFIAGRQDHNPLDLVKDVVKKHADASIEDQFEEFLSLLKDSAGEYQRAVDYYFFRNMQSYMTTNRSRRADPGALQAKREAAANVRQVADALKEQIMVLDFLMPIGDGKPMRDCTGAEMAKLGNRYQKIADKVGKTKTVGAVLSEEQVRELMK